MKRILVYGDSIPWGMIPATKFERYPYEKRWPGILQSKLGNDYQIIEECLCARTIDTDDPREGFEGRNGMTYLAGCLDSQHPLDFIILSLGLNELKSIYSWTAKDTAEKMRNMIKLIQERKPNFKESKPRIILLSQPIVENTGFWGENWVGSREKSIELVNEYKKLAEELAIDFINIDVTPNKEDGVHLDDSEQIKIAEAIKEKIERTNES